MKELARTWGVQAPVSDLSVSAQDQLWTLLNAQAAGVAQRMDEMDTRLQELLKKVGAKPQDSHRWRVVQGAKLLNSVAAQKGLDSYEGLKALLSWVPAADIKVKEIVETITGCEQIHQNLQELADEQVDLVAAMAHRAVDEASTMRNRLRDVLCSAESKTDLNSGVLAWRRDAAQLIRQRALGQPEPEVKPDESEGTGHVKDKPGAYRVESIALEVQGKPRDVDTSSVVSALLQTLQMVDGLERERVIELVARLLIKRE